MVVPLVRSENADKVEQEEQRQQQEEGRLLAGPGEQLGVQLLLGHPEPVRALHSCTRRRRLFQPRRPRFVPTDAVFDFQQEEERVEEREQGRFPAARGELAPGQGERLGVQLFGELSDERLRRRHQRLRAPGEESKGTSEEGSASSKEGEG